MTMQFSDLDLNPALLKALQDSNFSQAREVQHKVIPLAMDGSDLLVAAPTGSGKTLAFVLPIIQRLLERPEQSTSAPRALIITPTRELAQQIDRVVEQLTVHTRLKRCLLIGGVPYGMHVRALEADIDILVGTPGRLLELERGNLLDLSVVEILVIDEADRLLDMGFIDALLDIGECLPSDRQSLLFSATLEADRIQRLAETLLAEDVQAVALESPREVAAHVQHFIYQVDNEQHKEFLLKALVAQYEVRKALVFVASRKEVDHWVTIIRSLGIRCEGLHGDLPQKERTLRLKRMRRGRTKVLVATDIASRGLDLPTISHVINLYLPQKADSYVHRAGRAGRADAKGTAWSLVDGRDWPLVGRIERYLGEPLVRQRFPGLGATHPEPSTNKPRPKKDKKGVPETKTKRRAGSAK